MIKDDFDLLIYGTQLRLRYLRHDKVAANYPVLVFLHDSLGCITLWRDFPEKMARATGCNVLIYDRQGYGQSAPFTTPRTVRYLEDEAEILMRVLDQCDIPKASLFGHSDGGSISLVAAAEYPNRIHSVISEAAHVFVDHLTIEGIVNTIKLYQTTNLRERIARYHGDKVDAIFAAWTQTWTADWYRHWSIEHYLSRIQCPVMVIQGEFDEFGTLGQLQTIARQVAGVAQPCLIAGIGHTPHKEAQAEVLKMASEFIKTFLPKTAKAKA